MRLALIPLLASLCWPAVQAVEAPATTGGEAPASATGIAKAAEGLVVERDQATFWDDGKGTAYRIQGYAEDGTAKVETEIGEVGVPRKLLKRADCLAAMPKFVALAQNAGIGKETSLQLAEGIMTGLHLRSDQILVLSEGVLRKAEVGGKRSEVDQLRRAIDETKAGLNTFEAKTAKAIEDVLERLPLANDARKFEHDEVVPTFARQVVRSGWMRDLVKAPPIAQRLEAALAACEKLQPTILYTGEKLRLAKVDNAFGEGGWILETPTRSAFARTHSRPMYHWGAQRWNHQLIVDLPAGANPLGDVDKAVAARLLDGETVIAAWSRDQGFQSDLAAWRLAIPDRGRGIEDNAVKGYLPPHIILADLDGDVRQLITAHGVLVPPKDTSTPEAERFLADAAKALPDAAHLDLLGEHLFYYVYDSPDSRQPYAIGNRANKGDIHQTAFQTLATVANGICRGDCDDLSELYQEIAERQGRIAHVISLPQHAACAFAEQQGDQWHVFVLQTGQPREFAAATLPDALRAAYLSFDENDSFDPNGLGLLLRFTGENTRGAWRLSWRIFAEADYAKTMIDVQKDWHFSTYQRGIHKMQDLIAAGDEDTANYRELAGLATFTGQDAMAVQYLAEAIERTDDPESRLYTSVEQVGHLYDADQKAEAGALATRLLDQDLPKLKDQLGQRIFQFGLQLAMTCANGEDHNLAARALADTVLTDMTQQIDQVAGWIASPQFNQRRWEAAAPLRRMQQMYVGAALSILEGLGPKALAENEHAAALARSAQTWLDQIAFHDVEETDDVLTRYASAASFHEALLGSERLDAMLADAPLADDKTKDHTKRVGGIAQVALDLPWIKTAPTYWYGRLREATNDDVETVDRDQVARLAALVDQAHANADKLGIEDPWLDGILHQTKVIAAVIAEDEALLRERLKFVTAKDDKRLRDDSAQILGDLARFCSKDWYARILQAWVDECDYKPKYYWIAWRAALTDAPEHALMAGELAAKRFKEDKDFQEELAFMKELFAPKGEAQQRQKK